MSKTYTDENKWGREKARKLYGSENMVGADRAAKFKNAGSEMVHKYTDTTRESKLMEQDSPNSSMERGQGGESRIEPVQIQRGDKDTED